MPLHDLSKVTSTLMTLLRENIKQESGIDVTVTPQPAEKVGKETNKLSLHLYHVAEDSYYKNAPGPGSDVPNVARAPMALRLYYILTVHHDTGDDSPFDPLTQQLLMGFALKTLHDFPVITDRTRVNGTEILDPDLRGRNNTLQVILRPVTPEDALDYWNSQETRTTRLSAYYEVRIVMLEPQEPKTMPGVVLSLGTFLFQLGSPHLERSQSRVRFQIPWKNGGTVHEVEATPARVTLDGSATPPAAHNRLLLLGTNLAGGKSQSLFFRNRLWANLAVEETVVDLGENPDWGVDFRADRVVVNLAPTLHHINPDGTAVDLPVFPGFYTAFSRSVMDEKVINNVRKRIVSSSNEVSFAVAPRIQGHDDPDGDGNIQINLGPEFDPLDANLPDEAIQVIVAGEVYTSVSADPPTGEKEFFVTNNPSNLIRIKPHFPVAVTQAEAYPLRLIVNGPESAPFWIELNP
jgi:hypothetical protein